MQLPSLSAARSLQTPRRQQAARGQVRAGGGGLRPQALTDVEEQLYRCLEATGEPIAQILAKVELHGDDPRYRSDRVQSCFDRYGGGLTRPVRVFLVEAAQTYRALSRTKPARRD